MATSKSTPLAQTDQPPTSAIEELGDIEGHLYEIANLVEVIGAAPDSSVQLSDGAIRGAASIAELELNRVAERVAAVRGSLQLTLGKRS